MKLSVYLELNGISQNSSKPRNWPRDGRKNCRSQQKLLATPQVPSRLPRLLANSVNLIRDRFGFYHASIFLLDRMGEFALLRESTGEVGAQMKERGHHLAVGSQSIVGQVLLRKKEWVVNNVQQEPLYFANPLLPETRSELAIPLIVGERILGVVDVQSRQENAFMENEVKILRILADQLAIAVWNSILFGQNQETLAQHRLCCTRSRFRPPPRIRSMKRCKPRFRLCTQQPAKSG